MIISLHIGKTAGMSFAETLKHHYQNRIMTDYLNIHYLNDHYFYTKKLPKNLAAPHVPPRIEIIHGHMLLAKWTKQYPTATNTYVTWLRHPVKRLASHYQYFQDRAGASNKNHRVWEVITDNWSFEQFCFSNVYKNWMYYYLCGVPIDQFKFIGITEHFNEDFKYFFEKYCNARYEPPLINPTNTKLPEVTSLMNDQEFVNKVLKHHSKDATIYHQALTRRQKERG